MTNNPQNDAQRIESDIPMDDGVVSAGTVDSLADKLDHVDKVVRFNELMDLYGGLLTERQSRLARMHFEEDLSFSEIAREEGITRQAAHDAVKHATLSLEKFEQHLGLCGRLNGSSGRQENKLGATDESNVDLKELEKTLKDLRERLKRSTGVIYSSDWIVKELDRALELLKV